MKTTAIFIFSIFLSFSSMAQEKREKIKALKVAFITEKLDLSQEEAQQFWPIYNGYEDRMYNLRHFGIRSLRREIRGNLESISEKRANAILDEFMEIEKSIQKERTQLIEKLKKVLSAKKIVKLKITEEDFNRKMLDQYKRRRGENMD